MIFIGSGGLLTQAVNHAFNLGVMIEAVYCPIRDSSVPKLKKLNLSVVETNNPNIDLLPVLKNLKGIKVFSINNKFILDDPLLESGHDFFNIHNGLVQSYRGIAEVCIFAAICRGEKRYGVTLHKLLPGQAVDSGPVVGQMEFDIELEGDYFAVMRRSLEACQNIFEENLMDIIDGKYASNYVELLDNAYSYKDIQQILKSADPTRLSRACNLGFYKPFLPKLAQFIEDTRRS